MTDAITSYMTSKFYMFNKLTYCIQAKGIFPDAGGRT